MSTTTELDALLGDSKAALLALRGQVGYDCLLEALALIPADEEDTTEIINGALALALGDATLEDAAAEVATTRRAAVDALDRARGAVLWERASGTRDADLERRSGVARSTVRYWTGR